MTEAHHLTIHDLPGLVVNRIFHALGPRDLAVASSVCNLWRQHGIDSLSDRLWQGHYTERWREVPLASRTQRWQVHYGAKLQQLGSYRGRFQQDRLSGHAGAVRCIALQPAHNQLATGSVDRTMRLWDLQAGIPRATSRRLGGTVRGLALDEDMLVAGTSQDYAVRVWRSEPGRAKFDLRTPKKLAQHTGPVSSVALCASNIFSGSWDYSVRIWDRDTLACRALLSFPDWVDCLAPRGSNLLVAAGGHVYVHSMATAQRTRVIECPQGSVDASARLCIEGRRDSRLLFAGTAAGQVLAFDLRAPGSRPAAAVLGGHAEPVAALAMEDPWLAAAHGAITLVDVDVAMRGGRGGRAPRSRKQPGGQDAAEAPAAARQLPTPGATLQCVDLADQFAAGGAKSGAVQVFDFSGAAAAQERSQAARQGRRAARQARAEHNVRLAAQAALRTTNSSSNGIQHAPMTNGEPSAGICAAAASAPQPVQPAASAAYADAAPGESTMTGGAPAPGDQEAAAAEQSNMQHEDGSQAEHGQRHVPRWRIIRPQRCKYRHMTADPYEEVEVGA